jgi:hypothetical protein
MFNCACVKDRHFLQQDAKGIHLAHTVVKNVPCDLETYFAGQANKRHNT